MASLGSANLVGESIAALLRSRRSLLVAENRFDTLSTSADIAHVSIAKLSGTSPPTAGLSISCYHIGRSDHPVGRQAMQDPSREAGISLELSYLMTSWSSTPDEEQSLLSWAMLELNRYAVLDRAQLIDGAKGPSWERGESIQIVPEDADPDRLFRLFDGLKQKYRLSTLFKARILRIGYGPASDALPVVASRFSFSDSDPLLEPAS